MEIVFLLVQESWNLLGQMAPFLLMGFAASATVAYFLPESKVQQQLGGSGLKQVLKATLLGIPLPLCSCSVLPVTASLRRRGASKGASLAFLLATPQTGVDSILVTYSLLGWVFAAARPLAALLSGILGGAAAAWVESKDTKTEQTESHIHEVATSCGSCCSIEPHPSKVKEKTSLRKALHHAFIQVPRDIGKPLLAGTVAAAVVSMILPENFFDQVLGRGWSQLVLMMLIGLPIYVCATASVPLAAAFMAKGVSPGAALVFLMTGPASNAASIGTVWKVLGKKVAVIYLVTVAISALIFGTLLNWLWPGTGDQITETTTHTSNISKLSAIILLAVFANAYLLYKENAKKTQRLELELVGVDCPGCAVSLEKAIKSVEGVEQVSVSGSTSTATVVGSMDAEEVISVVKTTGFSVAKLKKEGGG